MGAHKRNMSYRARKFGSLDANHHEVANALRSIGCSVGETSAAGGFCDIVAANGRYTVLFEIKKQWSGGDNVFIALSQLEFASAWKGYIAFVSTKEQAVMAMQNPNKYCVSKAGKNWIAQYVIRFKQTHKSKTVKWGSFKKSWEARNG